MKKIINIIGALVLAFIMPLSALAENTPPAIPAMFYGGVMIDGNAAPIGTDVVAQYGSNKTASFKLTEIGKYFMNIPVNAGTVKFTVNDKDAGQIVVTNVPSLKYDLVITTSNSASGGSASSSGGGGIYKPVIDAENVDEGDTDDFVETDGDENGQVLGATSVNVADGDIIQCANSADPFAVYIVKIVDGKKYIRHIVSLQIFNFYTHLKWENLVQVDSLDDFSLSGWVRVNTGANGNPGPNDKVYEINGDQTRHWIDMTAEEFLAHGGSEEAIFNINAGELSLYAEGPAVVLR